MANQRQTIDDSFDLHQEEPAHTSRQESSQQIQDQQEHTQKQRDHHVRLEEFLVDEDLVELVSVLGHEQRL